jgi:potassium-transporting ATPase KdpC subunit
MQHTTNQPHTSAPATETRGIVAEAWIGVRVLLVLIVLGGALYPLSVYVLGQALFGWKANGSLVDATGRPTDPGRAVASTLLGQSFKGPRYFCSRPSAAGDGYDASNSSGSNLGPLSDKLLHGVADDPNTHDVDESFAGVAQLAAQYRAENGLAPDAAVPADAVTRSASGLDPHVSPQNAELQVARVARERALSPSRVRELVREHTEGRDLGLFGDPRVNVVLLNLALDQAAAEAPSVVGTP